jgi:hypothetical protein
MHWWNRWYKGIIGIFLHDRNEISDFYQFFLFPLHNSHSFTIRVHFVPLRFQPQILALAAAKAHGARPRRQRCRRHTSAQWEDGVGGGVPCDPHGQVRDGAASRLHGDPRGGASLATRAANAGWRGRRAPWRRLPSRPARPSVGWRGRQAPVNVVVQVAGLAAADLLPLPRIATPDA